jgi:indole-3-glycerol phosphate synthase
MVSPLSNLIRKAKLKETENFKQSIDIEGDSHYVKQFIDKKERPAGVGEPTNFKKSITNRYNTLSVMPEYNKKAKTGFIAGMQPPEIIGGVLRDSGAKAIVVSMDKKSGGTTTEEFVRFCKEQNKARKFSPGPISIVWNDFIVDKVQVLQAAALGASAVVLYPDFTDDLNSLVAACRQYEVEPVVLVKTESDVDSALTAGSSVLFIHSLDEAGILDLRSRIKVDESVLMCAKLRAEIDFSVYSEIDTAWVLRDNGFSCVWPSPEAIFGTGMGDIYGNILAMKSKASGKFLSPRQFLMDRNKEGAKEYLGDILY